MAREPASDPTDAVGIAFALAAAMGFGLAIAVSRFAYEGGTNGFTVASLRSCVATLVVFALCVMTGRSVRVTRREWLHLSGLGVLLSVLFYGNVGAVEYISVGLTALLLFTYPTMIGTMEAVLARTVPAPAKVVALATAFAGMFLMLGGSFGSSHPLGIALVLAAAVATASNAVWYSRAVRHVDIIVATLHMTIAATVTILVVSALNGSFVLPVDAAGWGGLLGVVALQSGLAPVYFAGIARIGALKSGMLANIQPVTSIVAAFLLFGEWLTPVQLLGGAMVIAGILIMQRHDVRVAVRARTAARAAVERKT